MAYFFTSDTHFSHQNILKYTNRGKYFQNIDEMNKALIKNWNQKVSPNDDVFHLGDFCFFNSVYPVRDFIDQLNGNITLINGNHDSIKVRSSFKRSCDYLELKIESENIILMHFPIESWNRMRHNSFHFHGHCHGTLKTSPHLLRYDVGVDVDDKYAPYSFKELKDIMVSKMNIRDSELDKSDI